MSELSQQNIENNAPNYGAQGVFNAPVSFYQQAPPRVVSPADLAAAQALLAQMPVGDDAPIPLPSDLAPCSFLNQLTPNPLFTGRDAELRAIVAALRARPGTVAITTGIGGVGKTQLAIEFAHRYGPYFVGGVFWVSCADPAGVASSVAACGARGLIDWRPDYGQLKVDEQLALVGQAWQSPLPRLLVFDNCEAEDLLAKWRPPTGGCRVLVTSRRANWGAAMALAQQPLRELGKDDSAQLLLRYHADLGDGAAQIAIALGGLPLALHLAGSFLRRYRSVTANAYLAQLGGALVGHPSLQGRAAEASPTGHELHIAQTFALSYDQLRPEAPTDASARALLARAACLAPGESIPRKLLLATLGLAEDVVEALMQAEDGLARLVELGLAEAEGDGALRLHRLLADYVTHISFEDSTSMVEHAVVSAARQLNDRGDLGQLAALEPHLAHRTRQAFDREDVVAADLCYEYDRYLSLVGQYSESRRYSARALAIRERLLPPGHIDIARSLNSLGWIFWKDQAVDDGPARARVLLERAIAIFAQQGDTYLREQARACNNYAIVLCAQEIYDTALSYHDQALDLLRRAHVSPADEEHLTTLTDRTTTFYLRGLALRAAGHTEEAKQLFAQVQNIYQAILPALEKALGEVNLFVAFVLQNLGESYFDAYEDRATATFYCQQALNMRRQLLGSEDHTDVVYSRDYLRDTLRSTEEV
jgi:tetratricopeptide (TPR) repeat protein